MTCFGNSVKCWPRQRIRRLTTHTNRTAPGTERVPPVGYHDAGRFLRRPSPTLGCRNVVARRSRRARRQPFTERQRPPYVVRRRAPVGMEQGKRSASVRTAFGIHSRMARREFRWVPIVRVLSSACRWTQGGRQPPHHPLRMFPIATSPRRNAAPTSDGWPRAGRDLPTIRPS
jgi:hypothetical protein